MRWMVRTGAAMLVALLVVFIPVGSETPASAVSIIPPVDPAPGLPSTTARGLTSAGGIGDDVVKVSSWLFSQLKNVKTVPGAVPTVPITAAAPLTTVTSAGAAVPLVNGFLAGFALGQGGLRVYGMMNPEWDALPGICGDPLQGISSILYADLMPDCNAPVGDPNADVLAGFTAATWNGGSIKVVQFFGGSACANYTPPLSWSEPGTGRTVSIFSQRTDGTWAEPGIATAELCKLPEYGATDGTYVIGLRGVVEPVRLVFRYWSEPGGAAPAGAVDPVLQEADPLRDAKCKVTMSDGSVRSGFIGQYRESEGFPMGAVSAACTDALGNAVDQGLLPETIELTSTDTDTGNETTLARQDVPDFTESERVGLTPGDGTGLRLLKVINAATLSCMTWEASCVGWWSKTDSGTRNETDEGTYRCEYGGRQVALAECGIYRHTFDTQTSTPTITDPATGEEAPWSSTGDPANEYGPGGQSNQAPSQCVVTWSWNPVDWVLRPIRCAFEPRQSKIDQAKTRITATWHASALGAWATAIGAISFIPPSNGCDGLVIPLGSVYGHGVQDMRILKACPGDPLAPVASASYLVLAIVATIGLIVSVSRSLGRIFGFGGVADDN